MLIAYQVVRSGLYEELRRTIKEDAATVAALYASGEGSASGLGGPTGGVILQIYDASGRLLAASEPEFESATAALPPSDVMGAAHVPLSWNGLVAGRQMEAALAPFELGVVAVLIDPSYIGPVLAEVSRTLFVAALLVVALSLFVGYVVSAAALRPISRLARLAATLGPDDLEPIRSRAADGGRPSAVRAGSGCGADRPLLHRAGAGRGLPHAVRGRAAGGGAEPLRGLRGLRRGAAPHLAAGAPGGHAGAGRPGAHPLRRPPGRGGPPDLRAERAAGPPAGGAGCAARVPGRDQPRAAHAAYQHARLPGPRREARATGEPRRPAGCAARNRHDGAAGGGPAAALAWAVGGGGGPAPGGHGAGRAAARERRVPGSACGGAGRRAGAG